MRTKGFVRGIKNTRRLLAVLLSACVAAGNMPHTAFAAEMAETQDQLVCGEQPQDSREVQLLAANVVSVSGFESEYKAAYGTLQPELELPEQLSVTIRVTEKITETFWREQQTQESEEAVLPWPETPDISGNMVSENDSAAQIPDLSGGDSGIEDSTPEGTQPVYRSETKVYESIREVETDVPVLWTCQEGYQPTGFGSYHFMGSLMPDRLDVKSILGAEGEITGWNLLCPQTLVTVSMDSLAAYAARQGVITVTDTESLRLAFENIPDDGAPLTIQVSGNIIAPDSVLTVPQGATIDLCGSDSGEAVITMTTKSGLIKVDGYLKLSNIILDANSSDQTVIVTDSHNAKVYIDEGTIIKGNVCRSSFVMDIRDGSVSMAGGEIRDNEIEYQSAVNIGKNANFFMSGGKIKNNISTSKTGVEKVSAAVYVNGYFYMSGGTLEGNYAAWPVQVGGIFVAETGKAILTSGEITSDNYSQTSKAGIDGFGHIRLGGSIRIDTPIAIGDDKGVYIDSALSNSFVIQPSVYKEGGILAKPELYAITQDDVDKLLVAADSQGKAWYAKLEDSGNIVMTLDPGARIQTVYLDNQNGRMENSGTDLSNPVRTFEQAKNAIQADGKILTVGNIRVTGEETWSLPSQIFGESAVLARYQEQEKGSDTFDIRIKSGAVLYLNDIVIENLGSLFVEKGGNLIISGNVRINNNADIYLEKEADLNIYSSVQADKFPRIIAANGATAALPDTPEWNNKITAAETPWFSEDSETDLKGINGGITGLYPGSVYTVSDGTATLYIARDGSLTKDISQAAETDYDNQTINGLENGKIYTIKKVCVLSVRHTGLMKGDKFYIGTEEFDYQNSPTQFYKVYLEGMVKEFQVTPGPNHRFTSFLDTKDSARTAQDAQNGYLMKLSGVRQIDIVMWSNLQGLVFGARQVILSSKSLGYGESWSKIELQNKGSENITISSLTMDNPYFILEDNQLSGSVIGPGETVDLRVGMTLGLGVGYYEGHLEVEGEDGSYDCLTIGADVDGDVYEIIFDANGLGTAPEKIQIGEGNLIPVPDSPVQQGYQFGGWYQEAACIHPWNFQSDRVAADMALYAKWRKELAIRGLEYPVVKLYDGTRAADLTGNKILLEGVLLGDEVTAVSAVGRYQDPAVGDQKQLVISDIHLGGEKADQYILMQQEFIVENGRILPRDIVFVDPVYGNDASGSGTQESPVSTPEKAMQIVGTGKTVVFEGNVTADQTIMVDKKVILDLNGHVIDGSGVHGPVIQVRNDAHITIKDSAQNGQTEGSSGGIVSGEGQVAVEALPGSQVMVAEGILEDKEGVFSGKVNSKPNGVIDLEEKIAGLPGEKNGQTDWEGIAGGDYREEIRNNRPSVEEAYGKFQEISQQASGKMDSDAAKKLDQLIKNIITVETEVMNASDLEIQISKNDLDHLSSFLFTKEELGGYTEGSTQKATLQLNNGGSNDAKNEIRRMAGEGKESIFFYGEVKKENNSANGHFPKPVEVQVTLPQNTQTDSPVRVFGYVNGNVVEINAVKSGNHIVFHTNNFETIGITYEQKQDSNEGGSGETGDGGGSNSGSGETGDGSGSNDGSGETGDGGGSNGGSGETGDGGGSNGGGGETGDGSGSNGGGGETGDGGGSNGGSGETGDGSSGGSGETGDGSGSNSGSVETGDGGGSNGGSGETGDGSNGGSGETRDNSSETDGKNVTSQAVPERGAQPQTGDYLPSFATLAMIAGMAYLIDLFIGKRSGFGLTETQKNKWMECLIKWGKGRSRLLRIISLAVIFLMLVVYYSVGKKVEWEPEDTMKEAARSCMVNSNIR